MLDTSVIRILSGLLAIILFVSYILFFGAFTRKKQDPGSVRASKPTGFILMNVWLLLGSLPIIFYVLGGGGAGIGLRDASQPFFLRCGLSPALLCLSRIVCTVYFSLERPGLGTIHEARDRGQGET